LNPSDHRVVWIVSIVAALAFGVGGTLLIRSKGEPLPPPLLSLERIGHLVSVKAYVADIVEFTEPRSLGVPWSSWKFSYGGTKVLLILKGDCLVGTDLRAGKYEAIDQVTHKVTLVLPTPEVLQARVNHAPPAQGGSRLYAISNQGVEAIIPGDANRNKAIDAAMQVAQKRVEDAGSRVEVIDAAKANAELLLKESLAALGWNATIRWK